LQQYLEGRHSTGLTYDFTNGRTTKRSGSHSGTGHPALKPDATTSVFRSEFDDALGYQGS